MMDWTDGFDAMGSWMAVYGVVVVVAVLVCTVALIRMDHRGPNDDPLSEAERELRMRLARGEIDVDEFLREQAALRR